MKYLFLLSWVVISVTFSPKLGFADNEWRANDKYNLVISQMGEKILRSEHLSQINSAPRITDKNTAQYWLQNAIYSLHSRDRTGRENYKDFVSSFRRACMYSSHLRAPYNALTELAEIFYTGIDITSFNSNLVCRIAEAGNGLQGWRPPHIRFEQKKLDATDSDDDFESPASEDPDLSLVAQTLTHLPNYYKGIVNAPSQVKTSSIAKLLQNAKGSFSRANFDPNLQGNLISVKSVFQTPSGPHYALRMPSQTINSKKGEVEIAPEFLMYLKALEKKKNSNGFIRKHTYINFQKIADRDSGHTFGLFEDERWRGRKIHELAETQKNLIVISLNKNSDFYFQTKEEGKSVTFAQFKNHLINLLVPKDDQNWKHTGIRLNDLWNPSKFSDLPKDPRRAKAEVRNAMSEMIDRLGAVAFNFSVQKNTLISAQERQPMLELLYNAISDYASRESFSSNRTCKDGIDRGGGANALTYFVGELKSVCKTKDKQQIQRFSHEIPGILFSDALITRKREIVKERMEVFQNTALKLLYVVKTKGCKVFNDENLLGGLIRLEAPKIDSSYMLRTKIQDPSLTYRSSKCPNLGVFKPRVDVSCSSSKQTILDFSPIKSTLSEIDRFSE